MPTRHPVLPVPVDSLLPAVVNDRSLLIAARSDRPSELSRGVPRCADSFADTYSGDAADTETEPDPHPSGPSADAPTLVLEERFSIVPEWVLDAEVSDAAVRLYAVLLRYGQSSGQRMPSRRTLADRLRKKSVDSVDRALRELVGIGAVEVTRRCRDGVNLTNRYLVRATRPGNAARPRRGRGGRTDAATPVSDHSRQATADRAVGVSVGCQGPGGGRRDAATPGRTDAARVAARMRPNPEFLTQNQPPPHPSSIAPGARDAGTPSADDIAPHDRRSGRRAQVLALLGISDLADVAARCADLRRGHGLPAGLWTARRLADVVADAVLDHGLPAVAAIPALLALAADPATRSPARLRCPGPWWDTPPAGHGSGPTAGGDLAGGDVAELEAVLAEVGGLRVVLQRRARGELAAEGLPVTRSTVTRRAVELLGRTSDAALEVDAGRAHSFGALRS